MQPITEELIHQSFDCYEGTTVEKVSEGWTVTTPCGRKVNIHPYHIDFRGITKLLAGEKEEDREQLQFELMTLAQEAWGVVSLISCRREKDKGEGGNLWFYGKCYKLKMEGPWWPFGSTQVKRFFDDDATLKLKCGGYRIDAGKGKSAVISLNSKNELLVKKVAGGGEVLEAAIRLVNEAQGYVIAAGSAQNILFCMACAQSLGIEAIPELYFTQWQHTKLGMLVGFIGVPVVALSLVTTDPGKGLLWGMGILVGLSALCQSLFMSNRLSKARERGQALIGIQPVSGRRQSNMDDARARGML